MIQSRIQSPRLSTVGAVCAISTVACFVLGGVSMGSSGVQLLIPETGEPGLEWIADVDGAGGLFFTGAWLIILMGFLGIVALVGFYDVLRDAGEVMVLAPILGTVGLTLVTVSHLVPISMAYELVPAYSEADPAGQATLAATFDTFAATALVTNSAGNFLGWGWRYPCSPWRYSGRAHCPDGSDGSDSRRGTRRMARTAEPRIGRDRGHLQHRLHRILRVHAQHGRRYLASARHSAVRRHQ